MPPAIRLATPDDLAPQTALLDQYRQFYEQPADLSRARSFVAERMAPGARRMDLTTAHTNTKAQALYTSLGWQLDTVFRAYTWTPPDN